MKNKSIIIVILSIILSGYNVLAQNHVVTASRVIDWIPTLGQDGCEATVTIRVNFNYYVGLPEKEVTASVIKKNRVHYKGKTYTKEQLGERVYNAISNDLPSIKVDLYADKFTIFTRPNEGNILTLQETFNFINVTTKGGYDLLEYKNISKLSKEEIDTMMIYERYNIRNIRISKLEWHGMSGVDKYMRLQEKQQEYKGKISQANNEYQHKNYESAKSLYKEAMDLKPDDTYAEDKITEINNIQKKQEEAKKLTEQKSSSNSSNNSSSNKTTSSLNTKSYEQQQREKRQKEQREREQKRREQMQYHQKRAQQIAKNQQKTRNEVNQIVQKGTNDMINLYQQQQAQAEYYRKIQQEKSRIHREMRSDRRKNARDQKYQYFKNIRKIKYQNRYKIYNFEKTFIHNNYYSIKYNNLNQKKVYYYFAYLNTHKELNKATLNISNVITINYDDKEGHWPYASDFINDIKSKYGNDIKIFGYYKSYSEAINKRQNLISSAKIKKCYSNTFTYNKRESFTNNEINTNFWGEIIEPIDSLIEIELDIKAQSDSIKVETDYWGNQIKGIGQKQKKVKIEKPKEESHSKKVELDYWGNPIK